MSDKTEEIRNRHKRLEDMRSSTYPDEISDSWTYFGTWAAHHDRATLLDLAERQSEENEKLRAEIWRLRAENERLLQAIGLVTTTVLNMEIDILNPVGMAQRVVAEFKKLRAEIEALHEALRRGDGDRFVVERRTTGPDTPVAFIREGKP